MSKARAVDEILKAKAAGGRPPTLAQMAERADTSVVVVHELCKSLWPDRVAERKAAGPVRVEYQAERAIQNAVAKCYRMVARQAGLEPPIAAALEQFSVTVDQGEISAVPLLRLLAGRTTPTALLQDLAEVLEDLDGEHAVAPGDLAELRAHADVLDGWRP
jgi:hypothetical protein